MADHRDPGRESGADSVSNSLGPWITALPDPCPAFADVMETRQPGHRHSCSDREVVCQPQSRLAGALPCTP